MLKSAVIQWFSQTILSSQTIHYSFPFLSVPNPTASNLFHIRPFITLIFILSTIKWQNSSIVISTQSPLLILCSGCAVHVSKSFKHPHAPNSLFHPVSFFSSQMQSPNLFQILHCFMYYKPRQFRPSLSPFFFFLFLCTLPTSLHLECCATPFMLPFQRRNAHSHISFFNSSHNFDSLRSASMRLSDKRSLYSSIHHYTAAQPVFGTKSFHCSQISFVFLNLLIGVCAEMPRSQWIAVCIDSIKKMICTSPDGLWTCLTTFYSLFSHQTGVLTICDERRKRGIFAFINFTLWTQLIILVYRTIQSGRSCDESVSGAECDECGERNEHGEGRRGDSEDGRLRWIDDVRWKMFKISHLREIDRTNE